LNSLRQLFEWLNLSPESLKYLKKSSNFPRSSLFCFQHPRTSPSTTIPQPFCAVVFLVLITQKASSTSPNLKLKQRRQQVFQTKRFRSRKNGLISIQIRKQSFMLQQIIGVGVKFRSNRKSPRVITAPLFPRHICNYLFQLWLSFPAPAAADQRSLHCLAAGELKSYTKFNLMI
jgi:hypothetical protein